MKYSKTAIGLLTAQYRSVLRKCLLINLGLFALGAVATATPANAEGRSGGVVGTDITSPITASYQDGNYDGEAGAILNESAGTVINGSTFSNNQATWGGAIGNLGENTSLTINGGTFSNNIATSSGGAIDNDEGATLTINNGTTFSGNTAQNKYGGAISSWGTSTINIEGTSANKVTFSENTSVLDGGAIFSGGDMNLNFAEFTGNTATGGNTYGGAIASGGQLSINNSVFDGNTSKFAGAIIDYLDSSGGVSVEGSIQNTVFKNNEAEEIGAVGLYTRNAISNFNKVDFLANKATSTAADSDGSGAIFVGAEARANITNSTFDGNTSGAGAGAIGSRSFTLGDNHAAKIDIASSEFKNNTAATLGGAIDNFMYNSTGHEGAVFVGSSTFKSNSAANGGAVYNHIGKDGNVLVGGQKQVAKIYFEDTNFTDNTASEKGGALYNEGEATIAANAANVAFSGNTANGEANDIYNLGTLTLNAAEGRTISLAGGIDGDADNKGTTNIAGAGSVKVANALKNQSVNNAGTLQLDGANLSGTTIAGEGTMEVVGDSSFEDDITINEDVEVKADQTLDINGATVAGTGDLNNAQGGTLNIKNSRIEVDVNNAGILYSDPTYYTKQVVNTGIATFDGDIFESTSELNNTATVNLLNGTEFVSGATITGTGTTNLTSGVMHFNNTANANKINVFNGANFDGTIVGGTINTQNGVIDAISGSVQSANVAIDVNTTSQTADTFAGASGSTIKSINVSGGYGTAAEAEVNLASGLTLANDAEINGGYYTKVEVADGKLKFSDKLVNQSGMEAYTYSKIAADDKFATKTALNGKLSTHSEGTSKYMDVSNNGGLFSINGDGGDTGYTSSYTQNADANGIVLSAMKSGTGAGNSELHIRSDGVFYGTPDQPTNEIVTKATAKDGVYDATHTIAQAIAAKQDALTPGSGIAISGSTISASGITTDNLAADAAIAKTQLASDVQASLGLANTAVQSVKTVAGVDMVGTGEALTDAQIAALGSGITAGKVEGYDNVKSAVEDTTTGLATKASQSSVNALTETVGSHTASISDLNTLTSSHTTSIANNTSAIQTLNGDVDTPNSVRQLIDANAAGATYSDTQTIAQAIASKADATDLTTKANVGLDNLSDAGNTYIDNRANARVAAGIANATASAFTPASLPGTTADEKIAAWMGDTTDTSSNNYKFANVATTFGVLNYKLADVENDLLNTDSADHSVAGAMAKANNPIRTAVQGLADGQIAAAKFTGTIADDTADTGLATAAQVAAYGSNKANVGLDNLSNDGKSVIDNRADDRIASSTLMKGATSNIYKSIMTSDTYDSKAVSAGALKQMVGEVGFNMKQDQLGWDINVDTSNADSFSEKLDSSLYNGLTKKTTARTVVGALNTAGNAIVANTNRFEDVLNPDTPAPTGEKYTVVQSITNRIQGAAAAGEEPAETVTPSTKFYSVAGTEQAIQNALTNPTQNIDVASVATDSLTLGTSTSVTGTSGESAAGVVVVPTTEMPQLDNAGSAETLATTASLNQTVNNVLAFAGQTFADKQAWLDKFTGLDSSKSNAEAFKAVFKNDTNLWVGDGQGENPTSLAGVFKNINRALGTIHGLANTDGSVNNTESIFKDGKIASKVEGVTAEYGTNLKAGTSVEDLEVSLDNAIGKIQTGETVVGKAYADQNGKIIDTTYAKLYNDASFNNLYANTLGINGDAQVNGTLRVMGLAQFDDNLSVAKDFSVGGKFTFGGNTFSSVATAIDDSATDGMLPTAAAVKSVINSTINDIKDGTIVAGKAVADQNGEVIDTTYAKLNKDATFAKLTATDSVVTPKLTLNGQDLTNVKTDAITAAGKANVIASTSAVAATVKLKAQDATYTPGAGAVNTASAATINKAILANDLVSSANKAFLGELTLTDNWANIDSLKNSDDTTPTTVAKAIQNVGNYIDNMGDDFVKTTGDQGVAGVKNFSDGIKTAKLSIGGSAEISGLDAAPTSGSNNLLSSGTIYTALADKVNASDLATVATTGDYNDLINTPRLAPVATSGKFSDLTVANGAIKRKMIADGAINKAKLADGVKASLALADTSLQQSALVTEVRAASAASDEKIATERAVANALKDKLDSNALDGYKIKDVADTNELSIDVDGKLSVKKIAMDKVDGLGDALNLKADKTALDLKADKATIGDLGAYATVTAYSDAGDEALRQEIIATNTVLGQTNTNLSNLNTAVSKGFATLNTEIGKTNAALAQTNQNVANNKSAIDDLAGFVGEKPRTWAVADTVVSKIEDNAAAIEGNAGAISNLNNELVATNQALGQTNTNLSNLNTAVTEGFATLNTEIGKTNVALAKTDAKIGDLNYLNQDAKYDSANSQARDLVTAMNNMDKKLNDKIDGIVDDIDAADHTWTGKNVFTKEVEFDDGIYVKDGDVKVAEGDVIVSKGDINVADGTIKTGSLTLSGKEVTDVDVDGTTITTTGGSATTLATTSTVMKSAENAKFTNGGATSLGTAATIKDAINTLGGAVDINTNHIGDVDFTADEDYTPSGNIAGTTTDLTTAAQQLDNAIGDRTYTKDNVVEDGEAVATSINKLDTAVGKLSGITADYAQNADGSALDLATAINNVATKAKAADGTLAFTEDFTKDATGAPTNLTDAIQNVAKNAKEASEGALADAKKYTDDRLAGSYEDADGNTITDMVIGDKATSVTIGGNLSDGQARNLDSIVIGVTQTDSSVTPAETEMLAGIAIDAKGGERGVEIAAQDGKSVVGADFVAASEKITIQAENETENTVTGLEIDNKNQTLSLVSADRDDNFATGLNIDNKNQKVALGKVYSDGTTEAYYGLEVDAATKTTTIGDGEKEVTIDATGGITTTGDAKIGTKFSVTAEDGSMSAAGGNFTVDKDGNTAVAGTADIEGDTTIGDKFSVTAEDGSMSAAGGNFTVDKDGNTAVAGTLNVTGATELADTLDVAGKTTLSSDNGMAFSAKPDVVVKSIDDGSTPVTGDGDPEALATTATVMTSAENAKYTGGNSTQGATYATVGADTIKGAFEAIEKFVGPNEAMEHNAIAADTNTSVTEALNNLATNVANGMGGAFAEDGSWSGSMANNKGADYRDLTGENLAAAVEVINSNIGTASELSNAYNGVSSSNTVNANIDAINETIGDLSGLNTKLKNLTNGDGPKPQDVVTAFNNIDATLGRIHGLAAELEKKGEYQGNLAEGTTVEQHLTALDKAIGNRKNYKNTEGSNGFVATSGADVATALTEIASNIGTAADLGTEGLNGVSSANTVNSNIASVNEALGDIDELKNAAFARGNSVAEAIGSVDGKLVELDDRMGSVERDLKETHHELRRGMASMAAMSALVPNSRSTGNTTLSLGTGAYSGHGAVAVGAFHYLTDNLMLNAGLAWSDSRDAVYRVGVSYSF